MLQSAHEQTTDTSGRDRQIAAPFLYRHHMARGLKRLVIGTVLATLVGLLLGIVLIPNALG